MTYLSRGFFASYLGTLIYKVAMNALMASGVDFSFEAVREDYFHVVSQPILAVVTTLTLWWSMWFLPLYRLKRQANKDVKKQGENNGDTDHDTPTAAQLHSK
ncbi:hypothetical protein C9J03_25270 [Photobacterium gaetbulicola]|uniref:hypothetical protein n=1 Tax=Photobacterium gaetbulicola TaxID=1295392 RepID=UPI000D166BA5|nr:hypothetical protein [Photobacterium gaetbulicola]PSU00001.1 hypothetical protein C9J03_25270 [Photobacterium gaetbulicola]